MVADNGIFESWWMWVDQRKSSVMTLVSITTESLQKIAWFFIFLHPSFLIDFFLIILSLFRPQVKKICDVKHTVCTCLEGDRCTREDLLFRPGGGVSKLTHFKNVVSDSMGELIMPVERDEKQTSLNYHHSQPEVFILPSVTHCHLQRCRHRLSHYFRRHRHNFHLHNHHGSKILLEVVRNERMALSSRFIP